MFRQSKLARRTVDGLFFWHFCHFQKGCDSTQHDTVIQVTVKPQRHPRKVSLGFLGISLKNKEVNASLSYLPSFKTHKIGSHLNST